MPLSEPVERQALHTRAIEITGYARDDGLFDIEARLTDTKSYAFSNMDRGVIEPGVPLHGMLARMTIDATMEIVRFEAVTEYGPYSICPSAAESFGRLAGLRVGRGFIRQANERIGGVHGCTHLRELLAQMGTVAFQTMYKRRTNPSAAPNAESTAEALPASRPRLLGTCLAYAPNSPVVQRDFPEYYVPG